MAKGWRCPESIFQLFTAWPGSLPHLRSRLLLLLASRETYAELISPGKPQWQPWSPRKANTALCVSLRTRSGLIQ